MFVFCRAGHCDLPVEKDLEKTSEKPCLRIGEGSQARQLKGRSGKDYESEGSASEEVSVFICVSEAVPKRLGGSNYT